MKRSLLLLALTLSSPGCTSRSPHTPEAATVEAKQASARGDPENEDLVKRAAKFAWRGDLVRARAELDQLSEARRQVPSLRFLRACIALQAGEFDTVNTLLDGWKEPKPAEVRLLQQLAALRQEQPPRDWRLAFSQAWRAAGRPDLRDSSLLPPSESTLLDSEASGREQAWSRARTDDARFLLALALESDADRARYALEHLPESLPPEFLIAAAAVFERDSFPEDVRTHATRVLRERFTQLAADHPDDMQYPALALLLGTSLTAPLTSEELQRIDALSRRSTWRSTDALSLYRAALGPLEATGLSPFMAQSFAYTLVVDTLVGPAQWSLRKRSEASQGSLSPEERQRLDEALWRIGERMAAQNTLVERFIGVSMMKRSALARGDTARQAGVAERREDAVRAQKAAPLPALERWPLPSLQEAMLEAKLLDEIATYGDFAAPDEPQP